MNYKYFVFFYQYLFIVLSDGHEETPESEFNLLFELEGIQKYDSSKVSHRDRLIENGVRLYGSNYSGYYLYKISATIDEPCTSIPLIDERNVQIVCTFYQHQTQIVLMLGNLVNIYVDDGATREYYQCTFQSVSFAQSFYTQIRPQTETADLLNFNVENVKMFEKETNTTIEFATKSSCYVKPIGADGRQEIFFIEREKSSDPFMLFLSNTYRVGKRDKEQRIYLFVPGKLNSLLDSIYELHFRSIEEASHAYDIYKSLAINEINIE